MNCVWFELLSRVVPFAGWRIRLCRWHVSHCLRCQQESTSDEALPPILVTAEQVPAGLDLWPGVQEGIVGQRMSASGPEVIPLPPRRAWRWAYAAAMALLLLVAGFWIVLNGRHPGSQPGPIADRPAVQTRICSAKIADRPARVFQVQSRNPDRTIFWIAKGENRS